MGSDEIWKWSYLADRPNTSAFDTQIWCLNQKEFLEPEPAVSPNVMFTDQRR